MTSAGAFIGAIAGAAALATAGVVDKGAPAPVRGALVIDASLARDGRELVDARLMALDAELRLPRTAAEARVNVRYFRELGYSVVVAGPNSSAAGSGLGVERARGLRAALAALGG